MKTYAIQQQYNPSFQKLDIYELPNWNRKLLNAVLQSKGIKEAAQKHNITLFQFHFHYAGNYNIFAHKDELSISNLYQIAASDKNHNLNSAIKQIENFDAKQFDNFVNSRLRIKKLINQKIEEYNKKLEIVNQPKKLQESGKKLEVVNQPEVGVQVSQEKSSKNNSFIQRLLKFFK